MRFHDDMTYIKQELVDRGLMRIVPYQIRLDRFFLREETAANKAYAESHNNAEWSVRCDEMQKRIATENLALMEFLEKYFTFGQYKEPYNYRDKKDYTFWFWCNDLYNTTNGRKTGRDYSYITLSLEKKEDVEENKRVFAKLKELLANYPAKNIQAIFQYSQVEVTDKVKDEAERIFNLCEGKFINYGHLTGRLERYKGGYIFKKKNAKKYAYRITPMDICVNVVV